MGRSLQLSTNAVPKRGIAPNGYVWRTTQHQSCRPLEYYNAMHHSGNDATMNVQNLSNNRFINAVATLHAAEYGRACAPHSEAMLQPNAATLSIPLQKRCSNRAEGMVACIKPFQKTLLYNWAKRPAIILHVRYCCKHYSCAGDLQPAKSPKPQAANMQPAPSGRSLAGL